MDVKVYKKEEVKQPSGTEYVYVPDVIDIIPELVETESTTDIRNNIRITEEQLYNAEVLDDNSSELLEQECALATIWQRGLDPLDLTDGIRWSEVLLEEINGVQLMQDIIDAVSQVSTSVRVTFSTLKDDNGNEYLTYKLSEAL